MVTRISSLFLKQGVPVSVIISDRIRSLRGHLDFEIGWGWGSCLNDWHVDLSATYGFQVFFDQNMLRHWTSPTNFGVSFAPFGNLYIQGLNESLRLDF
jgi:hypothetical protein